MFFYLSLSLHQSLSSIDSFAWWLEWIYRSCHDHNVQIHRSSHFFLVRSSLLQDIFSNDDEGFHSWHQFVHVKQNQGFQRVKAEAMECLLHLGRWMLLEYLYTEKEVMLHYRGLIYRYIKEVVEELFAVANNTNGSLLSTDEERRFVLSILHLLLKYYRQDGGEELAMSLINLQCVATWFFSDSMDFNKLRLQLLFDLEEDDEEIPSNFGFTENKRLSHVLIDHIATNVRSVQLIVTEIRQRVAMRMPIPHLTTLLRRVKHPELLRAVQAYPKYELDVDRFIMYELQGAESSDNVDMLYQLFLWYLDHTNLQSLTVVVNRLKVHKFKLSDDCLEYCRSSREGVRLGCYWNPWVVKIKA